MLARAGAMMRREWWPVALTTEKASRYLAERRGEILGFLKSLVEINSHTCHPAGVNRVGDVVSRALLDLGFSEKRFRRETIGDHRLFTRPGSGSGKKVLFSCHLDTVFPLELGFDTFCEGDRHTTGPGVIDMKGGITVLVQTLRMLDDLGLRGPSSYHIFLSADEETGSEDSRPLIEEVARGKDFGFVFECAGERGEVVSARKGVGTFRIEIEGRPAHAGNDYARGIDANLEAAHKLIELSRLTDVARGSTVNVGQVSGGVGANTISPRASLLVEMRYTSQEEGERLVAGLERIVGHSYVPGSHSQLHGRIQRPVMEESEGTARLLALVDRVSDGAIKAEKRGGVGDANFIAFVGVPTLDGFGPSGGMDHTPDEFMVTRTLFERMEFLAALLCAIDAEA